MHQGEIHQIPQELLKLQHLGRSTGINGQSNAANHTYEIAHFLKGHNNYVSMCNGLMRMPMPISEESKVLDSA
jgi:hypothetical protein